MNPEIDKILSNSTMLYNSGEYANEDKLSDALSSSKLVSEPDKDETSWFDSLSRIRSGISNRIAESTLGIPKEFLALGELAGETITAPLRAGIEQFSPKLAEGIREYNPISFLSKKLNEKLPSKQELRKFSKEYFPDSEPKSEFENSLFNIAEDVPHWALFKGMTPSRFLVSAAAGEVARNALKDMNVSETKQNLGKAAVQTVIGLMDPQLVSNYIKQQYSNAKNLIRQGQDVDVNSARRYLQAFIRKENNAIHSTENLGKSNQAVTRAQEFLDRSQNGRMSVNDLLDFKEAVNGDYNILGQFYRPLMRGVKYGINRYGQRNPAFQKHLMNADSAYSGLMKSRGLMRDIARHTDLTPQTFLGRAIIESFKGKWAVGFSLGTSLAAAKTYEMLHRGLSNPTIRNLYLKTLMNASRYPTSKFLSEIKNIEKEIEKNEKKLSNLSK